jgi:hypothetical protein
MRMQKPMLSVILAQNELSDQIPAPKRPNCILLVKDTPVSPNCPNERKPPNPENHQTPKPRKPPNLEIARAGSRGPSGLLLFFSA